MKLEIYDFSSADVDNLRTWSPASADTVFFQLEIAIGEKGKKGTNLFQLVVATPEGLRGFATRHPGHEFPDRGLLIFSEYSWTVLVKRLRKIVKHCTRDTWMKSIACLQRYFEWEYEDIIVEKEAGGEQAT